MATPLPQEAYDAYIRKNETWNLAVNILDLVFYNLANSFIYGSTVLSLYASYLTNSATLIGLIPALQSVGYFLPQLLMARRSEQEPHKKILVVKISVVERLPYLLVTLGILLWPKAPNMLSFAILALSVGLATFAGGLAGPAWNAMLAKVIRAELRGRYFGMSQALGGLMGIVGAAGARYVLGSMPYPTSFGVLFLLCFIGQVGSYIALCFNREPIKLPVKAGASELDYWRRLPGVLRDNPNFSRYLVSRALMILGGMGTVFYIIYARKLLPVNDAFAGSLTVAALITQTACGPFLGWLGDRWGAEKLTEMGALFGVATVLAVLVANSAPWFYAVFILANISGSASSVAAFAMIMDFSTPEELPTFVALGNTLLAIPVLLSPVLGGWLIDEFGYRTLFVVVLAFVVLGGAGMHWLVREPRHARLAV